MPWIDGEPVSAIIDVAAKKGGIPLPIAVNLVGQVCRGLHAAHELTSDQGQPLGLVHRDVSPENILVTREGIAKLADFGVATACGNLGQITGETDLGRARGKVWYMAPEELWGEPVDRRADLFALGVVLYRMTTGRHPFASGTGRESVRRLLAGAEPVPPRSFRPDYPEALEAVLLRTLAERPETRPRTALELRHALFKAVAPASDDDVAQYLAELFSGRRLERDHRLRVALESRPEPVSTRSLRLVEPSDRERSNRRALLAHTLPTRSVLGSGLRVVAAAAIALGLFVSGALLRPPRSETRAPLARGADPAAMTAPPPTSPSKRLAAEASPAAVADPVAQRTPAIENDKSRGERQPVDLSPVRDVSF
jgi:serine/threonine-protein kinase